MSQQAMTTTRMLVAGFDWGTRRVERFHRLIADYAKTRAEQGADSERAYEFVRTMGREVGETVNGAIMMADVARKAPRS
jgi:hypothetical protein